MPLYKVSQFAEMTGKKPKDIHAYVAQKKLVKTKHGLIDTEETLNASFLLKHGVRRDETDAEELETGMNSVRSEKGGMDGSDGSKGAYFLDKLKGELLEVNIQKGKIDLEKKHGEVFPIELVRELVMRLSKGMTEAYKQHMERTLDLWTMKFKIPHEEIVRAIKEMSEGLNKAQLDNIEKTKLEMKAVARELGSKRGVGQHE